MKNKSVVIFSGGQDSTTCLGWAREIFDIVSAVCFTYGQRHQVEVDQAKLIAERLCVPLTVFDLPVLLQLADSSLVKSVPIKTEFNRGKLPSTYVPGRNALFLTVAHAFAMKIGAGNIVCGVNAVDYSGYPDCRSDFIHSMQNALNIGYEADIQIHTPLIDLTKAEIFAAAERFGVLDIVLKDSHTCYRGDRSPNEWGAGCGLCDACKIRRKGYEDFISGAC